MELTPKNIGGFLSEVKEKYAFFCLEGREGKIHPWNSNRPGGKEERLEQIRDFVTGEYSPPGEYYLCASQKNTTKDNTPIKYRVVIPTGSGGLADPGQARPVIRPEPIIRTIEKPVQVATVSVDQYLEINAKFSQVAADLAASKSENSALKAELEQANNAYDTLADQYDELLEEFNELQDEFNELEREQDLSDNGGKEMLSQFMPVIIGALTGNTQQPAPTPAPTPGHGGLPPQQPEITLEDIETAKANLTEIQFEQFLSELAKLKPEIVLEYVNKLQSDTAESEEGEDN